MALHCSVCRLVLIDTARRYQHRSHHGQIAVCRRYHVGHDIAVIIFARPDKSALRANHARNSIINQRIEVFDAQLLKLLFVLCVIYFLKNILERMVIFLGNRIFGRKPQILLGVNGIAETCSCKARDGLFGIMNALNDSGALKIMNQLSRLCSVLRCKYQLCLSFSRNLDLCILVYITVGMTCDRDGLGPVFHIWYNPLD